jgi:hypothetical protein
LEKLGSNWEKLESNSEKKASTWETLVNMMAMMVSSFCLTRGCNLGRKGNRTVRTENTMEMKGCSWARLASRRVMLDYRKEMLENKKERWVNMMEK